MTKFADQIANETVAAAEALQAIRTKINADTAATDHANSLTSFENFLPEPKAGVSQEEFSKAWAIVEAQAKINQAVRAEITAAETALKNAWYATGVVDGYYTISK